MPRPVGGPKHPKLERALERLIEDVERDCSDEELSRLVKKIKRLTYRSLQKAMKSGGCVQVGPVIPPEGLIGVQTAATGAKAIETLQAIQARRIENLGTVAALYAGMMAAEHGDDERRPVSITVRYAAGVESDLDGDTAKQAAEPGPHSTKAR